MAENTAGGRRRALLASAAFISLVICASVVIKGGSRPVELGSVAPEQPPPLPAAAAHPLQAAAHATVAAQPVDTAKAGSAPSIPLDEVVARHAQLLVVPRERGDPAPKVGHLAQNCHLLAAERADLAVEVLHS